MLTLPRNTAQISSTIHQRIKIKFPSITGTDKFYQVLLTYTNKNKIALSHIPIIRLWKCQQYYGVAYLSVYFWSIIIKLILAGEVICVINYINKLKMLRFFTRNAQAFRKTSTNHFQHFTNIKPIPLLRTAGFASVPLFMYATQTVACSPLKKKQQQQRVIRGPKQQLSLVQNPQTIWQKFKSLFLHTFRMIQLILIFLPPILSFPLRLFKVSEGWWLRSFVWSVERAGVVWIKAFQYLSHRRDVIGQQMADSFQHLRENAPQHSFAQTKRNFKYAYGKEINEIFDSFDEIPIASGSVSQVYKAVYRGKKVAVKVRHPQVDKYIQRDVNILFGISKFLSIFSKSFQIPVGENSLKKTLIDQIDFNIQKDNLNTFNSHFLGNQNVMFPKAFEKETRDSILIESFVQGVPVTYFQSNRHPLNAVIARLGATAFFQMLMKNNFIHADCHGGNILVEVTKKSTTFFSEIKDYVIQKCCQWQQKVMEYMLESQTIKALYKSSRDEEKRIRDIMRKCTEKVKINLIDVGMVIRLDDRDRLNFTSFIQSVMEGNSQKCANLVYKLSSFNGQKILEGKFSVYMDQLNTLFSVLDTRSIFDIEGITLLISMLGIIREHNMKLEGQFATLLTNMMVLQSIAKEIDPSIQILKCAIPYIKYVDDPSKPKVVQERSPLLHQF